MLARARNQGGRPQRALGGGPSARCAGGGAGSEADGRRQPFADGPHRHQQASGVRWGGSALARGARPGGGGLL